ncbi:tyrosine-type recombinase/integrase [Nocardia ninae]|uniref:tyrosine-type recombinase/integrase n=1 Tax=Nocardia ninae TaxID=356145 RepID=UPI001649AAD2|nr:tyrosine-type recombinase/integrase [Nocardia ninae]
MLAWLESSPGVGWQQRWSASGIDDGYDWLGQLSAADPRGWPINHHELRSGMNWLLLGRTINPGYGYFAHNRSQFLYEHGPAAIDAEMFDRVAERATALKVTALEHRNAVRVIARTALHTGKTIRALTATDIFEQRDWNLGHNTANKGINTAWDLLGEVGVLEVEGSLAETIRVGQRPVDELVDFYRITSPRAREVLIRYCQERAPALDYNSLRTMIGRLVGTFWADIEAHHPGIDDLDLPDEIATAWKHRLRTCTTKRGTIRPRTSVLEILTQVRAFYLDIQEWAHTDPYWVQWAVRSPVRKGDTDGIVKARQRSTAAMHQRVRERLPQLPVLVDTATGHRDTCRDALDAATATRVGEVFGHDGHRYRRITAANETTGYKRRPHDVIVEDTETAIRTNLSRAEDEAFWTWAIIETLRHTGVRLEELLEITHLALTSYRLPDTGELVPLLQIIPSKTDEERLLLVSPELASVLASVISRLRRGNAGIVALTARYDPHERTTGPELPHLFERRHAHRWKVLSYTVVRRLLNDAVARTGLRDTAGEVLAYTAHDFRRMFATEAVTGGLPVHIAARLLGHRTIATTQTYLAVFQDDLIRAYRTYVDGRRALRPDTEYREPTTAEWQEFQQHFHTRKLELGTCARPYGTSCQHEHACLRCPMLRVAPTQRNRLIEIIRNLDDRITEATMNGWLGEVQGLKYSLAKGKDKLAALDRTLTNPATATLADLGVPMLRSPGKSTTA